MNHPFGRLRHFLLGAVLFVVSGMAVTGCSTATQARLEQNLLTPAPTPADVVANATPASPPDVANGARIYTLKCQACHGETGMGDGPRAEQVQAQGGQVMALADPARQQNAVPSAWFDAVTNGRIERLMPGFAASLTPQDRWDVLSYLWAMSTPTETLRAGQAIYAASCEACHGAQGRGDGPQAGGARMNSFADPEFLAGKSLADVASAAMAGAAHKAVQLDEMQRSQVAGYVRTLAYNYADPVVARQSALGGEGVLQLRADNLTPSGPVVKDLPVTLRVYDTQGEVFSRTETLDTRGVVTFTNLPVSEGYFYQPDILYNGAKFYASPQQFTGTTTLTATLPVYEVTVDPGVISISEYHYFVQQVGEGVAGVVEFYIFGNHSDRAYVDQPGPDGLLRSLKITIPEEAENLRFDGPGIGTRFSQDGSTIYDSDAVPPGERTSTIAVLYEIPYQGGKHIERTMVYPLRNWDVLLPEGDLRANGLTDKGIQTVQGGNIRLYTPEQPAVPAGGSISFELVGQPRGTPIPGDDGRAIGFGLVAVALAGGLGYFLLIRVHRLRALDAGLAKDRGTLLMEIADLDNRFAAGTLEESTYRKQREALKEQLRRIWD